MPNQTGAFVGRSFSFAHLTAIKCLGTWHLCRTKLPQNILLFQNKTWKRKVKPRVRKTPRNVPQNVKALLSCLKVLFYFFTILHRQFQTRFQTQPQTTYFTTRIFGIVQIYRGSRKNVSAITRIRQKCVRNASEMRQKCAQMGLVLLGEGVGNNKNTSEMCQKCVKNGGSFFTYSWSFFAYS